MKTINKGEIMNNFKKVGLSALAGSLAVVSANAAELNIVGSSTVAFTSGGDGPTKDSFGSDTGVDFFASGELDNGWTVSTATYTNNTFAVTSAQLTLGMGSMGTLQFNQDAGNMVRALDDKLPTAYEEAWDQSGHAMASSTVGAASIDGSISYAVPQIDLSGVTMDIVMDYDPTADVSGSGNGTLYAAAAGKDDSWGIGATVSGMGLTVYGAYEQVQNTGTGDDDEQNTAVNVVYAMGPLSIGYATWYANQGASDTADYEGSGYSIAFNVNDNLSISAADLEDTIVPTSDSRTIDNGETADITSVQAAYTMGSMAIKAQHTKTDNANFVLNHDFHQTEIAVSFAF
jgi:outer membrane protein OmpU